MLEVTEAECRTMSERRGFSVDRRCRRAEKRGGQGRDVGWGESICGDTRVTQQAEAWKADASHPAIRLVRDADSVNITTQSPLAFLLLRSYGT